MAHIIETTEQHDAPIQFTLPIAKVDKDKREVEGIASHEVVDAQGDVVDHDSVKAVLTNWPGNIREMHQPKAVGKAVSVKFDDDNRCTILRSRVSKGAPDTWEKVLDGTLSMYSIGGSGKRVTEKLDDGTVVNRLFMTSMHEISLVDNGACPTAKFQVVKLVDGEPTDAQPEDVEPAVAPIEEPAEKRIEAEASPLAEAITKVAAIAAGPQGPDTIAQLETVLKNCAYPETYHIERALSAIACLQSVLEGEWWQHREAEAAGDAEGEAVQRAELTAIKVAIELVLAFLVSEFTHQFASESVDVAMARRAEIAKTFEAAQPWTFGKVDGTGALWIAKAGARHSKGDNEMIQAMHDTAVKLGGVCKSADADAEKSAAPAPAAAPDLHAQAVAALAAVQAGGSVNPDADGAADAHEAEAGAEAAALTAAAPGEAETVQRAAQAAPGEAITPAPMQTPAETAAPPQGEQAAPVAAAEEQLAKLVSAQVEKALSEARATSDQTIAALQKRIDQLEAMPMPGGPLARAVAPVEKSIGGQQQSAAGEVDPAVVTSVLTQLAKEATTDDERTRLAVALLKFQSQTGAGAVAVKPVTHGA